jgi:hypothetical protein
MALDPQWQAFADRAKLVYDQTLKSRWNPNTLAS